MPSTDEIREAFNAAMASFQEDTRSSGTVRRGLRRLSDHSNLRGGIGPFRTTRSRTGVSVKADIETQPTQKYETVINGFKILQVTCKDLKHQLADREEKIRSGQQAYAILEEKVFSGEQAYAALEEKAQSNEASYMELVSKLTDQLRLYDNVYTELVSQTEEKNRSDMAAFTYQISKMEERIRSNEASYMASVSQMEAKNQANEAAHSELLKKAEEYKRALKEREADLSSLHETIRESVTCAVCHGIPTQPCSTDCRHIFCAKCLLTWWKASQQPDCPICRTISKSPPVRDPVQGLVAMARAQAGGGESDSVNMKLFDKFFPSKRSKAGRNRRDAIEIS